jgi:hypothetical protein
MEEYSSVLQWVAGILFTVMAFIMKSLFTRLDFNDRRLNRLEVNMAKNTTENETLFHRLDGIEAKLDRLLEKDWR